LSDIFSSMLNGQSSTVSTKKAKETPPLSSPVIFSTGDNPKYTFLLDSYISNTESKQLQKLIENKDIFSYQILYTLQIIPTEKDEGKTVWKFYRDYTWDFTKYISPCSSIIAFGKSLFSLVKCNDLDCSLVVDDSNDSKKNNDDKFSRVNGFYDLLLDKTYFYHSKLKSNIYPVDAWEDLIKIETNQLKNSFETWFLKKQLNISKTIKNVAIKTKPIQKILVDNPNEWLQLHKDDDNIIGIDTETKSLDPWSKKSKIICITIAFKNNPYIGYYLRFKDVDKKYLIEFLRGKKCIGTYLKYDFKFLHLRAGVPLDCLVIYGDTVQLQQLCNETMRKGLKAGAWLYTSYGGYDEELDLYIENHPSAKSDYSLIPEPLLIDYASEDPCISLLVHEAQIKYRDLLDAMFNTKNKYGYSLKWVYEQIMIPTLNVFLKAELEGLSVNKSVLEIKSKELQQKLFSLESDILLELGESKTSCNIASTNQLGISIKKLGWKIRSLNEKGLPTTGEKQLHEWEKDEHELATKILKYREQNKLLTTYVGTKEKKDGMYKWIRDDDLIHSLYNNFGALSLRNTSNAPNGQNYPAHGEPSKIVRSFLCPPSPEFGFISLDYSALQLRIIAIMSKDPVMNQAFRYEQGDIHLVTAYNVFLKQLLNLDSLEEAKELRENGDEKTKEIINDFRFKSKCINFGSVFGAISETIMENAIKPNWKETDCDIYIKNNSLNSLYKKVLDKSLKRKNYTLTDEEIITYAKYLTVATDIRKKFFEAYKGIAEWIERTQLKARKQGYVKSVYGVIRRLPYLTFNIDGDDDEKDIDWKRFHNYLNIALNSPVQTMESIIIHRTMIEVNKWIEENKNSSRFFGQIHDAIEAYTPVKESERIYFAENLKRIASLDYPEYKEMPFDVEANFSDYFGKNQLWDKGDKI
jgi:DNA polymerase I-like protein with 3'-5' exonuclease and polymerase domains